MLVGLLLMAMLGEPQLNENLLANPGFETVSQNGRPTHWDVFVMPQPGATGELDVGAAEGAFAAMLHTPVLYPTEPVNNWSQAIVADFPAATYQLTGSIKTESASEAALWIQFFRQSPLRVVAAATSSTDAPMYGTQDWTPFMITAEAPEGTDFAVIRCVIKGAGTAWFDALRFERIGDPDANSESDDADLMEPESDADDENENDSTLQELSDDLREAIGELRDSNGQLRDEISNLESDLLRIRQQLQAERNPPLNALEPQADIAPAVPRFGHPLIPSNRTRRR